jgi:class 3 adenylate cyclase
MALPSGLVTFLFTDIEGSTRLAQLLGPDYRPVLHRHRALLGAAIRAHQGVVMDTFGDSSFAVFPDPAAALSASRAAQRALLAERWPGSMGQPRVRMGVHSGPARPRGGEYTSPEVHRAARIAAAAHGGQVLCSAATARAATPLPDGLGLWDLGLHRLRGFDGRERLFQLVAPDWRQRFPRPRTEPAPPHNLPAPVTPFVGRRAEQARLAGLLSRYRLVTVVGPAGVGKTRLAVRVAGAEVGAYPDGVWFLDLATVADPDGVALTLAATLGVRPEPGRAVWQTLADLVAARRLLLVLDSYDAQPGAVAPVVSRLVAAGPGVRVLATGREPVGMPDEVVWRLRPLSLAPPSDGRSSDAVTLLTDRVAAARGGDPVPAAELPDLERIAAWLDGVPLALERAAARLRVLTAGQLAARLEAPTRVTPPRVVAPAARAEIAGPARLAPA